MRGGKYSKQWGWKGHPESEPRGRSRGAGDERDQGQEEAAQGTRRKPRRECFSHSLGRMDLQKKEIAVMCWMPLTVKEDEAGDVAGLARDMRGDLSRRGRGGLSGGFNRRRGITEG